MRRLRLAKTHMLVLNAKRLQGLLYEGFAYYTFLENYIMEGRSISNLTMLI